MRILQSIAAGLLVLCLGSALAFAFDFPPLTGPVVDQADILTAASRSDIAAKSIALQEKSGIQLVVATVRSLEGSDIETYANQLFRTWKLGQAQKNNGVLLLVAPAVHKVRIEVGYGLEGTLTDALSSAIISGASFRASRPTTFPAASSTAWTALSACSTVTPPIGSRSRSRNTSSSTPTSRAP